MWGRAAAGPLALFAVDAASAEVTRHDLLSARRDAASVWVADSRAGPLRLKPYAAIGDETYRRYHKVALS